ncbi:MAG: sulfur carrier protein ThiS [Bacteroidales bacterium]|nr:sulfur carrier protein ThiS [Bacteroidales bacterium]
MEISVNNKKEILPSSVHTVSDYVSHSGLPTKAMAVAVNNKVIPRIKWDLTKLEDGDNLTVINAAFGG